MPKIESVDELFANTDIDNFVKDYNNGFSNLELKKKYYLNLTKGLSYLDTSKVYKGATSAKQSYSPENFGLSIDIGNYGVVICICVIQRCKCSKFT